MFSRFEVDVSTPLVPPLPGTNVNAVCEDPSGLLSLRNEALAGVPIPRSSVLCLVVLMELTQVPATLRDGDGCVPLAEYT